MVQRLHSLSAFSSFFLSKFWQTKQQQPFYGTLIQNNPGETVPETVGHINPSYLFLSCALTITAKNTLTDSDLDISTPNPTNNK